jgi:mRNA deadenylase 3'-5' endonuclease subunit Ccr4
VLFDYCPSPNLDPDYRCQLILAELAAYQADVMCLQAGAQTGRIAGMRKVWR